MAIQALESFIEGQLTRKEGRVMEIFNEYPYLCKYMDFLDLFDILKNKRLILRDPKHWEDRNDYFLIQQYLENKKIVNLFATCFTAQDDAYHFWKMYTTRANGACVKFKTRELFNAINLDYSPNSFRFDSVKYRTLKDVTQNLVEIDEYPYIKRMAFNAEQEVRLIYEEPKSTLPYRFLKIDLDAIQEIVIGPSVRDEYVNDCVATISSLSNGGSMKIRKSTILQSAAWQRQLTY